MLLSKNHWVSRTCMVIVVYFGIVFSSLQLVQGDDENDATETGKLRYIPIFPMEKPQIITSEELAKHDGQGEDKVIWLSILGEVYDVTKGAGYYAKGNGYEVFAARDGSVPFITGTFTPEEAAKPILEALSDAELFQLEDWRKFYMREERYPLIGLLHGYYYDENGAPTTERTRIQELVTNFVPLSLIRRRERAAQRQKEAEEAAAALAAAEAGAAVNSAFSNLTPEEIEAMSESQQGSVKPGEVSHDQGEL